MGGTGDNSPCGPTAVYFECHVRRRIKGAFEEVFSIPVTLRIGPGTAGARIEVLLAPHNQEGGHRALEVAKGDEGFPHFFMLFYFIFVLLLNL